MSHYKPKWLVFLASLSWGLILPATIFLLAVVLQKLGSASSQPALAAHQFVSLYAGRAWTLWLLLLTLPFLTMLIGGVIIMLPSYILEMPGKARYSIYSTTGIAGVILAIVILHMAAT